MRDFWTKQRILIIAPHPDDEVFGCAGLIFKVKEAGGEVYLQVMTLADLHQYSHGGAVVSGKTRQDELEQAVDFLGIDGYDLLFTDEESHLRLDTKPLRELISFIEHTGKFSLDNIKPTMLLLPAPSFNQDHEATYKAGVAASRPANPEYKHMPQHVWLYEYPLHCWGSEPLLSNRMFVDISNWLEQKCNAVKVYASQLQDEPHPLSPEGVKCLAKLRGRAIGVKAAEAFTPLRLVL